jgi:pimeloyl-ACP methyl ester carboxylesterase
MALLRPERVASLVLCGTNASEIDPDTRAKGERFLAEARARSLDWALRAYLRTPLAAVGPEAIDALVALGARSVRTLANFLNLYRANVFRSDVRARLGEIRAPTLVLVGARDLAYFQDEARMLAGGIAGARLVVVPGAGHMVWEQNPRRFNRAVLDFLALHPIAGRVAAAPAPVCV